MVAPVDGRTSEAEEEGIGQRLAHLPAQVPSWVRCASSTITMMFERSLSLPPASPNLWMVVISTLRTSCPSSSCNSWRLATPTMLGTSAALKVALIWVSRSIRSTTMITVGLPSRGCSRSFCAAKTISSDLPLPWKCQMRPFFGYPRTTRATILLVASYC